MKIDNVETKKKEERDFSANRKVAYLHGALNKTFDISTLLNTKGPKIKNMWRKLWHEGISPFDQPTWE